MLLVNNIMYFGCNTTFPMYTHIFPTCVTKYIMVCHQYERIVMDDKINDSFPLLLHENYLNGDYFFLFAKLN